MPLPEQPEPLFSGQWVRTIESIPIHDANWRKASGLNVLPAGALGIVLSKARVTGIRSTVIFPAHPVLKLHLRAADVEPADVVLSVAGAVVMYGTEIRTTGNACELTPEGLALAPLDVRAPRHLHPVPHA